MNYPRRPMMQSQMLRPQPQPQFNPHQQPQPQERNFGTDLHAFMDGLSRIVQIAYSSLPVIAFIKVVFRYAWKFSLFLGGSVVGRARPHAQLSEASLDLMWRRPSMKGTMVKVAALALAMILLYRSKGSPDDTDEMDNAWDSSQDTDQEAEDPQILIRSEEDRVFLRRAHDIPAEAIYEDEEDNYDEEYQIPY